MTRSSWVHKLFIQKYVADVLAFKFSDIGGVVLSGATIVFPLTYLFGDIIAEVYGYETAKKLIWIALFSEFVFAIIIKSVINLP